MKKLNNVWAIVDGNASAAELERLAAVLGRKATVVSAANKDFFLNSIPAIVKAVAEAKPDAVITANTKNGRLLAGILAANLDTLVLSDLSKLSVEENGVRAKRMVYGGAAFRTETVSGTAVLCLGIGLLPDEAADGEVSQLEISEEGNGYTFIEKRSKEVKAVNLSAAKRIVSAGRGVPNEETLAVMQELATVIEAEVACTRPISEENRWMPTERYIGVSGAMVKPDIYLAVGISGQMQHTVGCNESGTIFAINKDKNAPIFKQCDYGIVADSAAVLPAILEALK